MARNGKIARLPRPLRDELNQRLARNEDGTTLLDWLNSAPDVKDLLTRDFAGEPVSKQNLYEWRHGGFVEWQSRQDMFAAAADLTDANGEWDALAANDFTERLAAVLVVRYADALAGWKGGDDEAFRLKLRDLRHFNQDLAVLRRYNQTAARLKMEQMPFYREEQQRAEAAASGRKQSEAGARAYDERLAQRRREAEAAQAAVSAAPAPSAADAPVAASLTNTADKATADSSVAAVIGVIGSPRTDRIGLSSDNELPTRGAANGAPAGVQPNAGPRLGCQPGFGSNQVKAMAPELRPSCDRNSATDSPKSAVVPVAAAPEIGADQCKTGNSGAGNDDAGKGMVLGAATFAAGLIRTNLVIKFVDSLRQASMVIEKRSSHGMNLKDRRAVQEAYAGSVASVNRLGKEAGILRAQLPALAEVDRLRAAVEVLQQEYPRMKPNLFSGLSAAVTTSIQQLRDAACELGETLQQKAVAGGSLAIRAA